MSVQSSLSRGEKVNLALIFGAALAIAVGSILFRMQLPYIDMPYNMRQLQYLIGFILLGVLPLLAVRGRTTNGRIVSIFLTIAIAIGLLFPPNFLFGDLVTNAFIAITVSLGGLIYFRFFNASLKLVLVALAVLVLDFYLYGVAYLALATIRSQDLRFGLAIAALTVLVVGIGNVLREEHDKMVGKGMER